MTDAQYLKLTTPRKPLANGQVVQTRHGVGVVLKPYEPQFHQHWGFDRYWVNFGDYEALELLGRMKKINA